ncbi:hypothetical protein JD965_06150 [Bacillus siamensis]|uniref:hypothetical protein n=1 Tax=Bacillus siamensis TaxID=659243 RepID=UPI0006491D7F|nr:hypothetical protein [Bacillus siamensis]MDU0813340.1 hypothetical protein [Bacillus siamensis]QQD83167.1 hypothetical protein JD965_06150 [Bacillus siamensis]
MDIFSKMMFGNSGDRDKEPEENEKNEENPEQPQSENEGQVDYNHVMNQLGSIMNSLDQLKPVFKDLGLGSMVSAIKKKIM